MVGVHWTMFGDAGRLSKRATPSTQNLKASPTGGEQTESKWSLESVEIGGAVPVLDNAMEVPRYPCAWFCYP